MIHARPLLRIAALVGLIVSCLPALAATSDLDLLRTYMGDWRGRGTVYGAEAETVVCRLSLTPGNADKVNYHGRCTLAGSNLSISGTLAYVLQSKRFEAVMSTNANFSGVAIGRRRGETIVFDLRERDRKDGNDFTISSGITLEKGQIEVRFDIIDNKTGGSLSAIVPFEK